MAKIISGICRMCDTSFFCHSSDAEHSQFFCSKECEQQFKREKKSNGNRCHACNNKLQENEYIYCKECKPTEEPKKEQTEYTHHLERVYACRWCDNVAFLSRSERKMIDHIKEKHNMQPRLYLPDED